MEGITEVKDFSGILKSAENIFSISSNISSIVGLLITIITLTTVTQMKRYYISKATVPEQIKRLSGLNGDMVKFLPITDEKKQEIINKIIKMEVIIKSLSKKVQSDQKKLTKEIIELKIKENINDDCLRKYYEKTLELCSSINEDFKDREWGI